MQRQTEKIKKQFSLQWAFEPFEDISSFYSKRMFGGLAAYVHEKIVMVLVETPGDRAWKEKSYDFDIWNGILIPTERSQHTEILKDFPNLVMHPVLPKWLYIPMINSDFENTVLKIAKKIAQNDERFGVVPKPKKKKKAHF